MTTRKRRGSLPLPRRKGRKADRVRRALAALKKLRPIPGVTKEMLNQAMQES